MIIEHTAIPPPMCSEGGRGWSWYNGLYVLYNVHVEWVYMYGYMYNTYICCVWGGRGEGLIVSYSYTYNIIYCTCIQVHFNVVHVHVYMYNVYISFSRTGPNSTSQEVDLGQRRGQTMQLSASTMASSTLNCWLLGDGSERASH